MKNKLLIEELGNIKNELNNYANEINKISDRYTDIIMSLKYLKDAFNGYTTREKDKNEILYLLNVKKPFSKKEVIKKISSINTYVVWREDNSIKGGFARDIL